LTIYIVPTKYNTIPGPCQAESPLFMRTFGIFSKNKNPKYSEVQPKKPQKGNKKGIVLLFANRKSCIIIFHIME